VHSCPRAAIRQRRQRIAVALCRCGQRCREVDTAVPPVPHRSDGTEAMAAFRLPISQASMPRRLHPQSIRDSEIQIFDIELGVQCSGIAKSVFRMGVAVRSGRRSSAAAPSPCHITLVWPPRDLDISCPLLFGEERNAVMFQCHTVAHASRHITRSRPDHPSFGALVRVVHVETPIAPSWHIAAWPPCRLRGHGMICLSEHLG